MSSGPRRGTRPRCPGRRRDERSSFSSPGAPEDFLRKRQRVLVFLNFFFPVPVGDQDHVTPPPPNPQHKLLLPSFFFSLKAFFGAEFLSEDAAEERNWTGLDTGSDIPSLLVETVLIVCF